MRLRFLHQAAQLVQSQYGLILLVVAINILIAFLIVGNYGQSWDEPEQNTTGLRAIGAYRGLGEYDNDDLMAYHGPFFDMFLQGSTNLFSFARPNWLPVEARHFTSFVVFQGAVLALYVLCLRFVQKSIALVTAVLFSTQPVLYGHAFINPKDTPFMAFFLATIALGLAMASAYEAQGPQPVRAGFLKLKSSLARDWQSRNRFTKSIFMVIVATGLIIALDVILVDRLVAGVGQALLPAGVTPEQWAVTYQRVQVPIVLAASVFVGLAAAFVFVRTVNRVWANPFSRSLVLGGLLLGWTTSIRFIGPFAGTLVSGYFLFKARDKAITPLLPYWGITALTTFATWPFLWQTPFKRLLLTFRVMGNFPWEGIILYRGKVFESGTLPPTYIPDLFSLQLTEPVLALLGIGLVVAIIRARSSHIDRPALVVVALWLFLPLAALLLLNVQLYDNFRHLLYVVPPMFILGGIGLEALVGLLRRRTLQGIAVAVVLLPGLAGIARLHPYEYTYYNTLVGGTRGAFREFELDFWCTSYKEAIAYVNEVASPQAEIAVWGPFYATMPYLRSDLRLYGIPNDARPGWQDTREPEYVVICSRANVDQWLYEDAEVVYEVVRDGAIMSVVRKVEQ